LFTCHSGQKDWDVIRKYGLVEFKGNDVISPKVLERMTDTDIKSVFKVTNTGDILRAPRNYSNGK
jgi:hypothetical protein